MAKTISLTKGKIALVDDEDYEYLSQFRWHYTHGYARRRTGGRKTGHYLYMHREILNFPNSEVDHIDQNKLNNQKSNLRLATHSLNSINKPLSKHNKSGYKGVHWDNNRSKWRAFLYRNNQKIFIGRFDSLDDAAKARENAAKIYDKKTS